MSPKITEANSPKGYGSARSLSLDIPWMASTPLNGNVRLDKTVSPMPHGKMLPGNIKIAAGIAALLPILLCAGHSGNVRAMRRFIFSFAMGTALAVALLAFNPLSALAEGSKKQIVFVYGKASHGYGNHAYGPAFRMLARMLNAEVPGVRAVAIEEDQDLTLLDRADAIVLGSDGGGLVHKLGDRLEPLMKKGVGLACLHYTLDPGSPQTVKRLIQWIGGSYEQHWSVNPSWEPAFHSFPDHPAARGLKPFKVEDEWYYHMRFVEDMKGVTPILSAVPPESTRQGKDGPHSGNPAVRARQGMPEVVGWVYQRPDGGRGFGFSGMHVHWNWAQDSYRMCVLNALVWIAGAEVPPQGVVTKTPSMEELEAELALPRPVDFNPETVRKQISDMNR
jgi:hypothetical protein